MKQTISKFIFRLLGWKFAAEIPEYDRLVIAVAPHTSVKDFFIGRLALNSVGVKPFFLMKKELFVSPVKKHLKRIGGISVDRGGDVDVVEQVSQKMKSLDKVALILTPEGTRSRVTQWKTGFLRIAKAVDCPIFACYIDFKKKEIGGFGFFEPTGDNEKDMVRFMKLYSDVSGKHPENFSCE